MTRVKNKREYADKICIKTEAKRILQGAKGIAMFYVYEWSFASVRGSFCYYRIAIYGVGFQSYRDIPIYTLEDSLPRVDAVIVAVVHLYHFIEPELERVFYGESEIKREKMWMVDVASLEEIVIKSGKKDEYIDK